MRLNFLCAALAIICSSSAQAGAVQVLITNVIPNGSNVLVALCRSALDPQECERTQTASATSESVTVTFEDVPPGRYAVAAYQDLDRTGVLRRGKIGLPLEPYGFSNGAGMTRRPKFEAAAFDVGEDGRRLTVTLRRVNQRQRGDE